MWTPGPSPVWRVCLQFTGGLDLGKGLSCPPGTLILRAPTSQHPPSGSLPSAQFRKGFSHSSYGSIHACALLTVA